MTPETVAKFHAHLLAEEGLRLQPYRCTAGKWTIGVGHRVQPHEQRLMDGITEAQADSLLEQDMRLAVRAGETLFGRERWLGMSPARQVAMASRIFQMGMEGVLGFRRMIRAIFRGDWSAAAVEALDSKWAKRDTPSRAKRVARMIETGEFADE